MGLLLCNNVGTTLAAAITTTGQTSVAVTSATGMPSPGSSDWFYLTISDGAVNNPETAWEVIKVTVNSAGTLTFVRAQDGTTAQTWANGAMIQSRTCVQELRDVLSGGLTTIGDTDYCSATQPDTHTAGTVSRLAAPTTNGTYAYQSIPTASVGVPPVWTLATGTGAPVCATSPVLTTPSLASSSGGTTTGEIWYDSTRLMTTTFENGLKTFKTGLIYSQYGPVTVATTASITTLIGGTSVGTNTLPASYIMAGAVFRIRAGGFYGTYSTAPTIIFTILFGATTIAVSGALTTTLSMTTKGWVLDVTINAASATSLWTFGNVQLSTSATAATAVNNILSASSTSPAAVTIGTTSQALGVSVTWGTSNAANTITCEYLTIERVA